MVRPFGSAARKKLLARDWDRPSSVRRDFGMVGFEIAPNPDDVTQLLASILLGGKPIGDVFSAKTFDVVDDENWSRWSKKMAADIVVALESRAVQVGDEEREAVEEAVEESRKLFLAAQIRAMARLFVHVVPAEEAASIWLEEEARRIFES